MVDMTFPAKSISVRDGETERERKKPETKKSY